MYIKTTYKLLLFYLLMATISVVAQTDIKLADSKLTDPAKLADLKLKLEEENQRLDDVKEKLKEKESISKETKSEFEAKDSSQTQPPKNKSKDSSEINVKNAEIAAIIKIFSRKTGRNFILDERVKGKVTMYLPGTIPPAESLKILDSVLALKGFTSVPIAENLWKVVPSKEAKQSTVPTVRDDENLPGSSVVTRLINLKYVSSEEVQQLISQIISPDGFVSAYSGTNSLLVIDYEDNIGRILDIIQDLDLPYRNSDIVIIPIKNADATEMADKIKELLGEPSKKDGSSNVDLESARARFQNIINAQQQQAMAQANAQRAGGAATGNPTTPGNNTGNGGPRTRSTESKIIADERTNSIIVVGDDDSIARIKALVSQLDTPIDLSGNRFYVYRCQHANAEELSDVLGGLVGEGGTSGTRNRGTNNNNNNDDGDIFGGGLSNRGLNGRNSRSSRSNSRLSGSSRRPGTSRNDGRERSGGGSSVQLGDDFSITADPATNSLIIQGSKADYEKIKSLLEKLDVKRRQVLVEATLMEVSINDVESLGTDFMTSTGGKDGGVVAQSNFSAGRLASLFSNPTSLQNFTLAAASAGSLTIGSGDTQLTLPTQTLVINAAKNNSNVNILSAPTLLATDNEESEIVVGQNIPFISSTSSNDTNLGNTFNQVDRQDVGITLRITPQISSQNYVTLKIFTDVSNVVSLDPRLGPTTSVRSSETTVITKDGQMIVIGGLISDTSSERDNGVPFLKDIPVLGQAFKDASNERARQNLLTFITPRIIKDQFDARDSTKNLKSKVEDQIFENEIVPDRAEILNNIDIDRVSEVEEFKGEKPGKILPPRNSNISQEESQNRNESPVNAEKPIELKLSRNKKSSVKESLSPDESKLSLPDNSVPALESGLAKHVIFEAFRSQPILEEELPFHINTNRKFGITIPAGSNESSKDFFTVGATYSYNLGDQKLLAKVVETHTSILPQEKFSGILEKDWYILSPYEVMNLGKKPWEKTK